LFPATTTLPREQFDIEIARVGVVVEVERTQADFKRR